MKKIIITAAAVVTASFGFYINESGSISKVINARVSNVSYENMLVLNTVSGHKLDIGQADIN